MKICVSAVSSSLDAQVDPRFGRCPYLLIVDSESMEFEAIESDRIEIVGKIPFDSLVTKAMVAGKSVVEHSQKSMVSKDIAELWTKTLEHLRKRS